MHAKVLEGIRAAAATGFDAIKINSVVMRGFNDDELVDLLEFGREIGAEVRFIEYMDVGGATHWSLGEVVSQQEMLAKLEAHYGPIEREAGRGSAPAERFRLRDGTRFGIVASVTEPFCGACDRSRLTADGLWYTCLYAQQGTDLKPLLRNGADSRATSATHSRGVGGTDGPQRRRTARRPTSRRALPSRRIASRSAPRDAHSRRLSRTFPLHGLLSRQTLFGRLARLGGRPSSTRANRGLPAENARSADPPRRPADALPLNHCRRHQWQGNSR